MASSHPALSRHLERVRRQLAASFEFLLHSTPKWGQMFRLLSEL